MNKPNCIWGHTLIDILKKFQEKFNLSSKPVVVADRGMLNNDNLAYLETNGYKYIIAAKIKNISNELKEEISNLSFINDSTIHTININKELIYKEQNEEINLINKKRVHKKSLDIKQRLILSYSSKRAKKDKYTREKAIEKIQSKISKNITKSDLKLSYYAKYLDIDNTLDIKYRLNPKKIIEDEKLDGIKGFITNDFTLNPNEIIQHYQNQYDIEKAFRISKTDLKIRPIYHRLETRIKAHILISFVAYAVYKEFERKIKLSNVDVKFKLTFDYIKTMYGYKTLFGVEPLEMDEIQRQIYDAIYSKWKFGCPMRNSGNIDTFIKENPDTYFLDFSKISINSKVLDIKTLMIGTEGGFSKRERELFNKNFVVGFSSNLILKSQTAIISATSKIIL